MLTVCLLSTEHQPRDIRDFVGLIYFCVPRAETNAWHPAGAHTCMPMAALSARSAASFHFTEEGRAGRSPWPA